jgi:UrcA family protein
MTMNTKPRIRFTAVLCLAYGTATLASLHTAAARAAQDSVPTRVVHFDDLDISKPAGAQKLYRRIEAAARQVCESNVKSDLRTMSREHACYQQAIDNAVRAVNSVTLANLHAGAPLRVASR